jgi:hypothetical protein
MGEKINIVYTTNRNYYAVTTDRNGKPNSCHYVGEFPDWIRTFEDGKTFSGSGMNAAKDKADIVCKGDYTIYEESEMNQFYLSIGQALAEGARTLLSSQGN